jgi:hypothetical protein
MRRTFIPLAPRLPLRAAGLLAVSVIAPISPFVAGPVRPILNLVLHHLCGSVKNTVRHRDRRLLLALFSPSA